MGVPPDRIACGHIQRNADVFYLRQILDEGVYLELDGTYRIKYQPDSNRIAQMRQLGEAGFEDRLLLGTDSGKRSYQKAYGAVSGVDFNASVDGPRMLAEGFSAEYVDKLLMGNGQRFFAMRGKR
jgi:phosphotriesterase-related protein